MNEDMRALTYHDLADELKKMVETTFLAHQQMLDAHSDIIRSTRTKLHITSEELKTLRDGVHAAGVIADRAAAFALHPLRTVKVPKEDS